MTADSSPAVLFDANALVALALASHVHHRPAHRYLASLHAWAVTPITETALYRLLLNPTVAGSQLAFWEVDRVVGGMKADPRCRHVSDNSSLSNPAIATAVLVGHRQVTDLHLVNLVAREGLRLATFDRALTKWLAPADRHWVVQIPT